MRRLIFETAQAGRDSACAVGVAVVDGGEIVVDRGWLIRPPGNSYNGFNIGIHGIRPSDTEHSPGFDRVWPEVAALIGSRLLVAHNTAFDMSVLQRSAAYHGYEPPPVTFLCTYRLCKSTWPNRWSYRLDDLAETFGIPLDHHDHVSDATAAARVALSVSATTTASAPRGRSRSCSATGRAGWVAPAGFPSQTRSNTAVVAGSLAVLRRQGTPTQATRCSGRRSCSPGHWGWRRVRRRRRLPLTAARRQATRFPRRPTTSHGRMDGLGYGRGRRSHQDRP